MVSKSKKKAPNLFKTVEFKFYLFISLVLLSPSGVSIITVNTFTRVSFSVLSFITLFILVVYSYSIHVTVEDLTKKEIHASRCQCLFLSILALATLSAGIYLFSNSVKIETHEKVVVTKEIPKGSILIAKETLSSSILNKDLYTFKVASGNEIKDYESISKKYSKAEGENVTKQETILVTTETKNILGKVLETQKELVEVLR
jgi:hypothetical protein